MHQIEPHWDAPGAVGHIAGSEGRRWWVIALVALWSARLAIYITVRNWGHAEDRRYQAIRARNEPGFSWKSVYLVFAFQAVLAWVISLPLQP